MVRSAGFVTRGPLVAGLVLLLAVAAVAVFLLRGDDPAWPVEEAPTEGDATPDAPVTALEGGRRPSVVAARPEEPARQGTIRGRVLTVDGKPVADVSIYAVSTWSGRWNSTLETADRGKWQTQAIVRQLAAIDAGHSEPEGEPRATSDPEGRFTFEVESETSYRVIARGPPPYATASAHAYLHPPVHEALITLVLVEGVVLKGRVLDANDGPVAATLGGTWQAELNGGTLPHVATDPATGAFEMAAVPKGSALILVRLVGRMDFTVRTPVPAEEPFVIRVPAGGDIEGRVTDPAGSPLRGVDLLISTAPRSPPAVGVLSGQARTKTGDDGSYRIVGMLPGRVSTVTMLLTGRPARTEQVAWARWAGAAVTDGATLRLDLVLGRGGRVKGRVLEAVTGKPVTDAEVYLLSGHSVPGQSHEAVRTGVDERGGYRFDDVPFGRYAVLPTSPRHYFEPATGLGGRSNDHRFLAAAAPYVVVSVEGEELERDVELTPGLALRGVVVDSEGTPVADAEVRATNFGSLHQGAYNWGTHVPFGQQPLAKSDADGRFVVESLPPMPALTLYAMKAPLTGTASESLRLEGGTPPPEVRLTLSRGATILGRVLDDAGRGVRGAQVNWNSQSSQAPGWGQTFSDDEGRFRLEGVAAATVQLNAWGGGGGVAHQQMSATVSPALKAGEVRDGIELKATASSLLKGIAVDHAGKPVGSVQLHIQGTNTSTNVSSQPDGTFSVNLPPGEYTLRQVVPQGAKDGPPVAPPVAVSARAPSDGVRVTVVVVERPFTLIGGRIVTKDGSLVPLCNLRVDGERGQGGWAQEVVGGEFRREVELRPPFTLVVSAPRGSRSQPINYKVAKVSVTEDVTDLVITLEGGLEVKGRVLAPTGEGAGGVGVLAGGQAVLSDASGAFAVGGLEKADPVPIQIQSSSRFVAPPNVTAVPGGDPVVIRLLPAGFVAGRVDGLTLTDGLQAWVYVSSGQGQSAQVGSDGTFRIEGLPAEGTIDLALNLWDPTGQPSPYLSPGAKGVRIGSDDVVLVLTTAAYVRGVVVGADGTPQAHVHIWAQMEGGANNGAQVGADGAFSVGPLPVGRWTLRVQARNGTTLGSPVIVDAPADGVRIVVPPLRRITVRVDGVAGRPSTVSAWTHGPDGKVVHVGSGRPDGSGVCTIDVTGDGPFQLRAAAEDRWARLDGVLPDTEVTLTLQPGYEIEGTVEREGQTGGRLWVTANGDGWSSHAQVSNENLFQLKGLPPGRYTLKLAGSRGANTSGEDVVVDAGARGVRLR